MNAIILVAGLGSRLKSLTDVMPKCLTEVNGTPILINALNILEATGSDEVTLVIGYLGDKLRDIIGKHWGKTKIKYVENDIYDKTNTSYSLWLALKELEISESILILEGDVFFEKHLITKLLEYPYKNMTIVEPYNSFLDGSFVELDAENNVIGWWHKNQRPHDFVVENKYKTVNIHKFNRTFIKNRLIPILKDSSIRRTDSKAPLEYVMKEIITENRMHVKALVNKGMKWFEIDDAADLKKAEEIFRDEKTQP